MEPWMNVLNGIYNSCLLGPCRGRDSPPLPLPDTPPDRPPLPLVYTEYRYNDRRNGYQRCPTAQSSHHRVEWCRGLTTDRGNMGTAHGAVQEVLTRTQKSNQHGYQCQENEVFFSKADPPNLIYQQHNHSTPRLHPKGLALQDWGNVPWPPDPDGYLRIEMHSPCTPTRFSHPGVEAVADPDAEYFTPRITPRALRRQVTSSSPAQRYHTWDRCELLDGPPLNPSTGFYYHSLPAPRSKMMIPKPRRLCISPQGVKISMVQRPVSMRATITPSSPPKLSPPSQHHFCPIQHHAAMPPSSWHQLSHYGVSSSTQNTETRLIHHPSPIKPRRYKPSETHQHAPSKNTVESVMENNPEELKSQVDVKAKNVFGQPLLFAALKRVQSPQLPRKNRVEENLRSLLSAEGSVENHRKVATIDGSLYKHPEDLGSITLSPSRTRRSTTPAFKDIHSPPQISMNGCGSLSELDVPVREVKKAPEKQAGLAQLDASATTQNQEHLMNGKSKVASICSSEGQNNNKTWSTAEKDSVSHSHREGAIALGGTEELTRQVHYLENVLGDLKCDLTNERKDNDALMAEVETLRQNNRHLLEESVSAYQELDKLRAIFNLAPGDLK